MEANRTRACELLVGLGALNVLSVDDVSDDPVRVHVETHGPRPVRPQWGGRVGGKERDPVELVDLPVFGRLARLVWRKHR